PEHTPSLDYVPDPEHPPPPSPIYVPEPEYPKYLVPSGDEAPVEDQPLPADASPTALSPGYVADSDPNEDQEKDLEEDHTDYPDDGEDGDDDPSDDNDNDDIDDENEEASEDEDDDEEEEEHLAPADSSVVPVVDHTVRLMPPMSASMSARIAEHAAAPTPPLSVSSPPLPLTSPLTISPNDAGAPLGYRTAGIKMRALLPSTSHMTNIVTPLFVKKTLGHNHGVSSKHS
nr:hypothetical protein [Tanacetum cinerariifolium]